MTTTKRVTLTKMIREIRWVCNFNTTLTHQKGRRQ
jgi:hypothetical protein